MFMGKDLAMLQEISVSVFALYLCLFSKSELNCRMTSLYLRDLASPAASQSHVIWTADHVFV